MIRIKNKIFRMQEKQIKMQKEREENGQFFLYILM